MKAEIISIGTELLLGHIVNTNAAYLYRKLAELGIDIYYQTTVGDNPQRLTEALLRSLGRADVVLTTGGLGPTVDDITAATLVKLASKKLILNKVGTAPGLIIERKDKVIIALPGPPRELIPMFERGAAPYLIRRFGRRPPLKSRLVKTTGLPESSVNHKVKDLLRLGPDTTVGIYAKLGQVDLKISSKDAKEIRKIEKIVQRRLGNHIFGYDDDTLEGAVGKILIRRRKTIAVAESCTGGAISNKITNVSGSSKYFVMGLTVYANQAKINMLGVREESIRRYGAVSPQAALEMAKGIRFLAGSDIGMGITGIAGPTGGMKKKPVGLVYIALSTNAKRIVRQFLFKGSREEIKFQASQAALNLLRNL